MRVLIACLTLAIVASLLWVFSKPQSKGQSAGKRAKPTVPVRLATVAVRPMPVEISAIGTIQPRSTVAVRAQVSGQLREVLFEEGREVRKGDRLFLLDRRPLEVALAQARAAVARDRAQLGQAQSNLARDRALAAHAEKEARRYEGLASRGIAPQEKADQTRNSAMALGYAVVANQSSIAVARAAIDADSAAVQAAELQLGFTDIRAPIAGRVGSVLVHAGNLIKANDAPLVVINEVRPIVAAFSLPERDLAIVRKYLKSGSLVVEARKADDAGSRLATGRFGFIDNAVDSSSGTIKMRGIFENADGTLWPGEFVSIILRLTVEPKALVVPARAVLAGQQGAYVYVVATGDTVVTRPVVIDRTIAGTSVVSEGLVAGERVVVDGQMRLSPGVTIESGDGMPRSEKTRKRGH